MTEYEIIFCLFTSFLNSFVTQHSDCYMCKHYYMYIVCTLMFAKRSFLTLRKNRRHKKIFLWSLSEVFSVQSSVCWEYLGGIYFWWLFRTLLTKPPFHCETTLPPRGQVRHCTNSRLPDETALKDRLLCFFSLLRNDLLFLNKFSLNSTCSCCVCVEKIKQTDLRNK